MAATTKSHPALFNKDIPSLYEDQIRKVFDNQDTKVCTGPQTNLCGKNDVESGPNGLTKKDLQQVIDDLHNYLETDPNGLNQHAPGAKLDQGKVRPYLLYKGF